MQTSISAPLEHYLGRISGLTLMSSSSSYGTSQITLQFKLSKSLASASLDVQAAINSSTGWLPVNDLPSPPIYHQVNPADMPVLVIALTSDTMPLHAVTEYAAHRRSFPAWPRSTAWAKSARRAPKRAPCGCRSTHAASPGSDCRWKTSAKPSRQPRSINRRGRSTARGRPLRSAPTISFSTAKDYRDAIIAYRNGAPVKFSDIGEAVDGLENEKLAAWYNGKPALILNVKRQPGANIIAVADAVKALLPQIEKSAPRGLAIDIAADRTTTIRAAVADVQRTLAITVGLVVLVIFIFLRKFWATLIPSVTLPVSLIATFADHGRLRLQPRQSFAHGAEHRFAASSSTTPSS